MDEDLVPCSTGPQTRFLASGHRLAPCRPLPGVLAGRAGELIRLGKQSWVKARERDSLPAAELQVLFVSPNKEHISRAEVCFELLGDAQEGKAQGEIGNHTINSLGWGYCWTPVGVAAGYAWGLSHASSQRPWTLARAAWMGACSHQGLR